jgi:RNA polymerase sigma-70 factor, ECF subfamily
VILSQDCAVRRLDEDSIDTLAAVAANDQDALARLLTRVQPDVVRYCQARINYASSDHSSEDVAQEVCLAIVKALPSYRSECTTFWSFVFSIASKKVVDSYRRSEAARCVTELTTDLPVAGAADAGPEELALRREQAAVMDGFLERLTERQQAILRLRVQGGLSTEETARILGVSPGAVRVAQHRALTMLRGWLVPQD